VKNLLGDPSASPQGDKKESHSEARSAEESPQETLRLRLRVTNKKPQGDKKGVTG